MISTWTEVFPLKEVIDLPRLWDNVNKSGCSCRSQQHGDGGRGRHKHPVSVKPEQVGLPGDSIEEFRRWEEVSQVHLRRSRDDDSGGAKSPSKIFG